MNEKMSGLMQKRAELLTRIASQREQMSDITAALHAPLSLADRSVEVVRYLRNHPMLVAALTVLFVTRRRGFAQLMTGSWRLWRGYRYMISLSEKLTSLG